MCASRRTSALEAAGVCASVVLLSSVCACACLAWLAGLGMRWWRLGGTSVGRVKWGMSGEGPRRWRGVPTWLLRRGGGIVVVHVVGARWNAGF